MGIKFYTLDDNYLKYLRQCEIDKRGFAKVPNIDKGKDNLTEKFYCGVVLNVHGINYFAPVSSYKTPNSGNFTIYEKDGRVIGAIRFNYMLPVPTEILKIKDFDSIPIQKYRNLVVKEWRYCQEREPIIHRKAHNAWYAVYSNYGNPNNHFVKNSCDFPLLEKKCIEYCIEHNYQVPHRYQYEEIKPNAVFVKYPPTRKSLIADVLTSTVSDFVIKDGNYLIAVDKKDEQKLQEIIRQHSNKPLEQKADDSPLLNPQEPTQPSFKAPKR